MVPLTSRLRRLDGSGPSDETGKTEAPSQQVWHDKDPFLLSGPKRRA
jgi:hypothetical protein